MLARAAAQPRGLPPQVLPWAPLGQSMMWERAMKPPMGTPLAIPLAMQITSGWTPHCSMANILPVRPKPVCTSSAMKTMPCSSHTSRMAWKKPAGGTL